MRDGDAVRRDDETIACPHSIQPLSDPARLAAVARLLGLAAPDPARSRVLDIGCGAGTNLLAMAARFPNATFTGIDVSAPAIASAAALAEEAGLTNVAFRTVDLPVWDPGDAQFDFIIAYGFFSWVRDPVKDALFATIRRGLAPQGIACVSYMTYPGCKQPEALRDLLRLRTQAAATAAERVATAQATLDFLDRAWTTLPNAPHVGRLRAEARRMREKEPRFFLFDDLGVERDPCYLMEFAQWAGRHGLRYLGDSEFHTMLPENLPPASARELAGLRLGALETEQMIDFVVDRSFRCTLLVGPDAVVAGDRPQASALRDLCLSTDLRLRGKPQPLATQARFVDAAGHELTVQFPPLVAMLCTLVERPGEMTSYDVALVRAERLAGRAFGEGERARLCDELLALYGRRRIGLSTQPFEPLRQAPAYPRLTPLNAVLARRRGLLATAGQEAIRLTQAERDWCASLDGRHGLGALLEADGARRIGDLSRYLRRLALLGCLERVDA